LKLLDKSDAAAKLFQVFLVRSSRLSCYIDFSDKTTQLLQAIEDRHTVFLAEYCSERGRDEGGKIGRPWCGDYC
jgi:hypothetical protein